MDKRHPSSFQQLEKLGEGTYATVRLFPLACFRVLMSNFLLTADLQRAGLQGPQPPDGRVCRSQGDPPRFRGGHP
jgi:hypothetical protein